jgi:hypothetical protein
MLRELKGNVNLGRFYVFAPENAAVSKDIFDVKDFEEVWQYGSDEDNDPLWNRDGIALQAPIGNIDNIHRIHFPSNVTQDFYHSHTISNYKWIFNLVNNGKVSTRN